MGADWQQRFAYGSASFSAAALHNLFITYYVRVFTSVYQVPALWFYAGQTVYAVWNSINDPLFGWLLHAHGRQSPGRSARALTGAIEYAGYAWIAALLWIFWPAPHSADTGDSDAARGLHFALSICLYDGLLSLVMLAHGALLADLAVGDEQRAELNAASAKGALLGSLSLAGSHLVWDQHDLQPFRRYLLVVGLLAAVGFRVFGYHFSATVAVSQQRRAAVAAVPFLRQLRSEWRLLLGHRNFWLFVAVTWLQVVNCHFNNNFMASLLDIFLPGDAHALAKSVGLSLAAALPHFAVIACSALLAADTLVAAKLSVYQLLRALMRLKLLLAAAAVAVFLLAAQQPAWPFFLLVVVLFKIANETMCRHGGLVLADLVDEDVARNARKSSSSALVFGLNALFTKSAQSFAPMAAWPLLQGADHVFAFYLMAAIPLVVALLQLLIWSSFTLRDDLLANVKSIRLSLFDSTV